MSAIRPNLPAVLPTQSSGQPPARAARSDFFKAALDAVQATEARPPALAAARVTAPESATAARDTPASRPGALLDIRV
ncbi:MAG: hypothetical protein ACOH1E_02115 [Brevundimonas sp.]